MNQCSIAENFGYEFKSLNAVVLANKRQRELMVEIKELLKTPILIDLRNLYESAQVKTLGLTYKGLGEE